MRVAAWHRFGGAAAAEDDLARVGADADARHRNIAVARRAAQPVARARADREEQLVIVATARGACTCLRSTEGPLLLISRKS